MLKRFLVAAVCLLGASGCTQTLAFRSVPAVAVDRAEVAGYANIRVWGDAPPSQMHAVLDLPVDLNAPRSIMPQRADARPIIHLALSGGGSDGAYGAGLLVGWSDAGTRPTFSIVTGVSTGALAAPLAFLGSKHDPALTKIYTTYSTSDLGTPRPFSAITGGPSLIDSVGLEALIARFVDDRLLAEIAREHRHGRRLLVSTTNVESERQVIWSLGAIAASGRRDALPLIRSVLRASAAIPGVFPPVLIGVTVDGHRYEEMHSDGGTSAQVFFVSGAATEASSYKKKETPRATLYVIRNGQLALKWQRTKATTFQIASRSLETLIKYQGRGDVERLYVKANAANIGFRLAAIPATFARQTTEAFDVEYMRALFELGAEQARRGYAWAVTLP